MRRVMYLSVLCVVLFSACIKESNNPPGTSARWKWDHSFGGVGAATIEPSENTSVVLVLSEDKTYRIDKNGQVALSDSFQTQTINNGDLVFKFKNMATVDKLSIYPEATMKIENGQLIVSDFIADGMAHYFKQ